MIIELYNNASATEYVIIEKKALNMPSLKTKSNQLCYGELSEKTE